VDLLLRCARKTRAPRKNERHGTDRKIKWVESMFVEETYVSKGHPIYWEIEADLSSWWNKHVKSSSENKTKDQTFVSYLAAYQRQKAMNCGDGRD
jgi:hypothetical protein